MEETRTCTDHVGKQFTGITGRGLVSFIPAQLGCLNIQLSCKVISMVQDERHMVIMLVLYIARFN